MPEPTAPVKTDPVTDPANPSATGQPANPGQEPVKPVEGDFDPTTLKDEDFDKIFSDNRLFRHPRFKSLSERAKKADDLEKARTEAENKALEEQGKWKEIAEKSQTELSDMQTKLQNMALSAAIQSEANRLGIVDADAAAALIDRTNVTINDDGTTNGVKEALEALIQAKPYLKGSGPTQPVGSPSNPNPTQTEGGTKKFKLSQLQDTAFWKENEKDIMQAFKLGLVEDDVHGTGGTPQPNPQQV